MNTSLSQVQQLQRESGAGILQCRNALKTAASYEDAVKILQGVQANQATKQQGQETAIAKIFTYTHHNNTVASMVKVSAKTDFVLNTPELQTVIKGILLTAAFHRINTLETLNQSPLASDESTTVQQAVDKLAATLKEPIVLSHLTTLGA